MRIKFKYKGIEYSPKNDKNAEKKLKQLGITWDDVEIITARSKQEETIEYVNPKLYIFKNRINGYTIESIYDNLDNLANDVDIENYEYVGMKEYGTKS